MIKISFEFVEQSRTHPLKINVAWNLESLGSSWIRFGSLSLQYKKVLERIRFVRRALPSAYKSLLARFLEVWNLN